MATRILLRSFSTMIARSCTAVTPSPSSLSSFSLLRLRPLVAIAGHLRHPSLSAATAVRGFSTRQTTSSLNDSSPNWSNRPPKETILLDGCDFEHWLVVLEPPENPDMTRDDIIDSYIKTLAQVVGSEEEARMKIYSVSTRCYYAFGALVSEELSYKIKELPRVRWVLPDSYLDVKNKDYGGEPFINGQAVPYDPKYHEEWIRNNARANERNRRGDRPKNFDRSRNFERRRENMQANRGGYQGGNTGGPGGMGGGAPPNMGASAPPSMGAGAPPNNMGNAPPSNSYAGPPPNSNYRGPPPSDGGFGGPPQSNSYGNAPPPPPGNNFGAQQGGMGGLPNAGGAQPNNWRGPPNMGGMPNSAPNYQQQYGGGYQQGPPANQQYGGGNPYQSQDISGRDMPPHNYR